MGFLRLLKQSIIFATRSRRLFVFILIFGILTGVTMFTINAIFQEDNVELIDSRSIVIEANNLGEALSVDDTNNLINLIDSDNLADEYIVRFTQLDSSVILFSLNSNDWANPIVRPDDIKAGNYLTRDGKKDNNYQVLASDGSISHLASNSSYYFGQDITVGNQLPIYADSTPTNYEFDLRIEGMFNRPDNNTDELWLFISDEGFDEVLEVMYPSASEREDATLVSHIVFTAKGSNDLIRGLLDEAPGKLEKLNAAVSVNIPITWKANLADIDQVKSDATEKDLFLLFGGLGSTIVATMYAFIISRFRTREIATLKAVGYTAGQVRVFLLAEIGTVSFLGYLISTFVIQILLTINSFYTIGSTYIPNIWIFWNIFLDPLAFKWVPSMTAILTFIVVVLSNIMGFFIISKRTVSVRPIELFRADA